MKKLSGVALVLFICFSSCYYDVESELYPNCELPETVSFSMDISPILSSNCAVSGCHVSGGQGPGNFSNFNQVKSRVDNGSFVNRVLIEQSMPPNSNLATCDLQILQLWVDQGAVNN